MGEAFRRLLDVRDITQTGIQRIGDPRGILLAANEPQFDQIIIAETHTW